MLEKHDFVASPFIIPAAVSNDSDFKSRTKMENYLSRQTVTVMLFYILMISYFFVKKNQ